MWWRACVWRLVLWSLSRVQEARRNNNASTAGRKARNMYEYAMICLTITEHSGVVRYYGIKSTMRDALEREADMWTQGVSWCEFSKAMSLRETAQAIRV